MKDTQTKEKFIELRAQGLSYDKISVELKTAKNTLISWSSDMTIELQNASQIQLDHLRELYLLTRVARIESFGKQLKKIFTELETRDFADMPTDKLLSSFMAMHKAIESEVTEIQFSKKTNVHDEDYTSRTKQWAA